MNNFQHDLISLLVNQKKYDAITEFCHSKYPDEKDVVVSEYSGADIRLFNGSDGSINILCPKEMSTIQESAVTKAIENGTIFDDAETVDNTAKYLELTSLPYNAIINNGKEIPKHMHVAIGGVIGNMNDEGRCEVDDASLRNGYQCMRDMMDADTSDEQSVNKIVDNYLGNPDHMSLHKKLRYDIGDLHDEIESIKDINPEDCITDEDCCESFDEYDMDEIETESYICDDIEYYFDEVTGESYYDISPDDIFYQEGVISMVKSLKKLDYDPKTKTIITDIPLPGSKNGEKVRANIKFADSVALSRGTCVTWDTDMDGNPKPSTCVIHVAPRDMLGKEADFIETVKHEEGHMAVRYNPGAFKKDFLRAHKAVDRNLEKLGKNWHGLSAEEYVADLYAVKHSGYKGAVLKGFLTKMKVRYNKQYKMLMSQLNAIYKSGMTLRHKIYHTQISDKEYDKLIKEFIKNNTKLSDKIDSMIKSIDELIEMAKVGREYQKEMTEEFLSKDRPDVEKVLRKDKALKMNIKVKIQGFKEILKSKCDEKKFMSYLDFIKSSTDEQCELMKACIREMNLRISFIDTYMKKDGFVEYYQDEYSVEDISENTNVYQEGFLSKKPKKLKPIPRDIVPYITVEMNAIRDSNDQAMLSGYTCSKLELVDFYLNVIDTNDERYIVPHTRQYLVQLQNDLNRLLTQILRIKPINKSDRVWQVNVNYPENWRG